MKSNLYFPNEDIRNVHLHQVVMVVVADADADADRFVNLMKIVKCRSTNKKFSANASVSSSFILDHNTHSVSLQLYPNAAINQIYSTNKTPLGK